MELKIKLRSTVKSLVEDVVDLVPEYRKEPVKANSTPCTTHRSFSFFKIFCFKTHQPPGLSLLQGIWALQAFFEMNSDEYSL